MSDENEKVSVDELEKVTDDPEKVTVEDFEGHKLVDRVGTDSEEDDFEAHTLTVDTVVDEVTDA